MAYITNLTFTEAVLLGTAGCVCLCTSYAFLHLISIVDRIGRNDINTRTQATSQNNERSLLDRITTENPRIRELITTVSLFATLLLAVLAFALWCAGAACITYAAIGPLIV